VLEKWLGTVTIVVEAFVDFDMWLARLLSCAGLLLLGPCRISGRRTFSRGWHSDSQLKLALTR